MYPDWTAIAALAQVGTLIAIPVSVWLYDLSRKREEQSRQDSWEQFYAILDEQYLEILKIIVEKPHLADQAQVRDPLQDTEYSAFAFIVWNFIESIFDYCEKDESLRESWHHILVLESKRHLDWFNCPQNRAAFKARFADYIDQLHGSTGPI